MTGIRFKPDLEKASKTIVEAVTKVQITSFGHPVKVELIVSRGFPARKRNSVANAGGKRHHPVQDSGNGRRWL